MKKITDSYNKYNIMPNLQLHQLRVASVAEQICESLLVSVDTHRITTACLVHDMANIVKFDLEYTAREFPEFFADKDIEYWQTVKQEYIEKYGADDHEATRILIRELNLEPNALKLAEEVLDYTMGENVNSFSLEACICKYADTRLTPHGVVSLRARLEEWQKRDARVSLEYMEDTYNTFSVIEKKIFDHSNMQPSDITDKSIAHRIEKLKNFEI